MKAPIAHSLRTLVPVLAVGMVAGLGPVGPTLASAAPQSDNVARVTAVVAAATPSAALPSATVAKSKHCGKTTTWRKIFSYTGGKYIGTVKVYNHPTKVDGEYVLELCAVAVTAKARKADKLHITWDQPGKNSHVSTAGRKLSSKISKIKDGQEATVLIDYFFTDSKGKRRAVYFNELTFLGVAP